MKQHIEEALHNSSISLASIVRELHSSNDTHQGTLDCVMEAYKNTRRAMDKNHEGKTYKSREAYDAITKGVFPNAAPLTKLKWDEIDDIASNLDLG